MNLAMLRNAAEYSPPRRARRGGVDAPSIRWIRSEIGAAGVVSSAKLFMPKHLAELTTITASRYRARASRPSAASSVASRRLLMPQRRPRWLVSLHDGDCPPLCDRLVSQHRQDSRPLQSCQYFSSFTLSRGSSESSYTAATLAHDFSFFAFLP